MYFIYTNQLSLFLYDQQKALKLHGNSFKHTDATGNQLEAKLSEGRGGGAVIECVPFVAGVS